jgi:hypothetical protein
MQNFRFPRMRSWASRSFELWHCIAELVMSTLRRNMSTLMSEKSKTNYLNYIYFGFTESMALVSWNSVPCELGYQSSGLISCPCLYAVYIYLELQHRFHRWHLSFCQAPYHRVIRRCAWQRSNFSIFRRNSNKVKSLPWQSRLVTWSVNHSTVGVQKFDDA